MEQPLSQAPASSLTVEMWCPGPRCTGPPPLSLGLACQLGWATASTLSNRSFHVSFVKAGLCTEMWASSDPGLQGRQGS